MRCSAEEDLAESGNSDHLGSSVGCTSSQLDDSPRFAAANGSIESPVMSWFGKIGKVEILEKTGSRHSEIPIVWR